MTKRERTLLSLVEVVSNTEFTFNYRENLGLFVLSLEHQERSWSFSKISEVMAFIHGYIIGVGQ